jgi:hypothetical protein
VLTAIEDYGQGDLYVEVMQRAVAENREDRALREAANELVQHGPRYALSVLIDYVRKEES